MLGQAEQLSKIRNEFLASTYKPYLRSLYNPGYDICKSDDVIKWVP